MEPCHLTTGRKGESCLCFPWGALCPVILRLIMPPCLACISKGPGFLPKIRKRQLGSGVLLDSWVPVILITCHDPGPSVFYPGLLQRRKSRGRVLFWIVQPCGPPQPHTPVLCPHLPWGSAWGARGDDNGRSTRRFLPSKSAARAARCKWKQSCPDGPSRGGAPHWPLGCGEGWEKQQVHELVSLRTDCLLPWGSREDPL